MLGILPLSVFVLIFLALLGRSSPEGESRVDPRDALLKAAVAWGAIALVIAESLGVFHLLGKLAMAVAWLLIGLLAVLFRRRLGHPLAGARLLKAAVAEWWTPEPVVLAVTAVIMLLLGIVALAAPPNTVDSLLYHMTRVAHWAQNGGLQHFATAYHPQLYMPPWAEIAILNVRVLTGTDRFANLIQWFSLVGCLVGVSAVAAKLGASARGQIVAAAFVLSLPMAILQATSTQNDLVVAFWLIALANQILDVSTRRPRAEELVFLGTTVALGLATKFTFYVYVLPFLVWCFLSIGARHGWATATRAAGLVAGLATLLNLGIWGRNLATYGSPIGPSEFRKVHQGPLLSMGRFPVVQELLSAEAQMMVWNLVPPTRRWKAAAGEIMDQMPLLFGEEYTRMMAGALWNHEDTAGNPIHLFLAGLTGMALFPLARRGSGGAPGAYGLASAAGYLLLPLIVSYAARLDGLRYQLVFFVSWAPLVGWTLARALRPSSARVLSLVLLILSTPWLLLNNTRPLLGLVPSVTRVDSVLREPPEDILFAMYSGQQDEWTAIARRIEESACARLGLWIDSHDPEYLIWHLLGAPESGILVEHVATYPELERYLAQSFEPCAVVCTLCLDEEEIAGLPMDRSFGRIRLYLAPNPTITP